MADAVLLLRLLRDGDGQVADAVIEFANSPWRAEHGTVDRDISGERLLESFPAFADRLPLYVRAVQSGDPIRIRTPLAHPVRRDPVWRPGRENGPRPRAWARPNARTAASASRTRGE